MLFSPTVYYIAASLILGAIVIFFFRRGIGRFFRRHYTLWRLIISIKTHWKLFSKIIFVLLLLLAVSALSLVWAGNSANQTQSDTWLSFVRSPGTVFVFVMALITALGFSITVKRIGEINSRFTRYDDFLVRATDLLQSEVDRSEHEERKVRILCTTPLAGNLSERGTGYFNEYRETLVRACERLVLQIVHLPENKLEDFYSRFHEEGRYEEAVVRRALKETESFLNSVADINRYRNNLDPSSNRVRSNHTLRHLWSEIGYRLILTEDRALFFVPLFLPLEPSPTSSIHPASVRSVPRNLQVEMIGFETEEPSIVKQLIENFDYVSTRSSLAGAEYLRQVNTPGGTLYLSAMHSAQPAGGARSRAILLVHGTTGFIEDRHWKRRLQLRDKVSVAGFASYEFDYRGRGRDSAHDLEFSIYSATEDLNAVIRYLFEHERHEEVWVVARGLGAYLSLASSEAKLKNCPLIFWQPILHPDRVMESRMHIQAYEQVYSRSEDHKYVMIGGVRLGEPFFAGLKNLTLPEALAWKGMRVCIFYDQNDKVAKKEWVEEFIAGLRNKGENEAQINYENVDADVRVNEGDAAVYIDKTIEFLQTPRWQTTFDQQGRNVKTGDKVTAPK